MPESSDANRLLTDVAAAILSGTPIDWPALEAGISQTDRELLEEMRLLCTVADVHRDLSAANHESGASGEDPRFWGRLRLLERIGGGSFGEVHRAWDPRLHREVALKLIAIEDVSAGRSAAIIREGRLLARVRHPGIVTIYDAERIGGRVGLSMEFVDGPTLEGRIATDGVFDPDQAVEIGIQLCQALAAAHGAGVLHRDVKAANVVIKPDGRVVLLDFGAGRDLDDAGPPDTTGTPLYIAPEVLAGHDASARSDVYSLGVLLHHMVTGSYPVQAPSLPELREAHARRTDGRLTHATGPPVPGRLASIVARATDPKPERRHESAAALASDLEALAHGRRAPRWTAALWGAVACLGVLGAAGWGLRPPEPVRIAIVPFELASERQDEEMLREGLTRDLIARLQTYENVRVISAASTFSLDARRLSLPEIGQRLRVGNVLSGQLSRDGPNVSANVRLVELPAERTVWSRQYTRPHAQLSELHRAITQDLASELGLTRAGGVQGWPTWNPRAHALYIKGQAALDQVNRDGRRLALQYFNEALVEDPDYAQVHAAIADLYLDMFPPPPNLLREEALRRALDAAARAMALDPNLPAAYVAAANVKSVHGDWEGAERDYERAIALGPADIGARQQYAHWLSLHGRFAEALRHAHEAERMEPGSPRAVLSVASVLRFARKWEDSIEYSRKVIALDGGFGMGHHHLGHNYQGLGRIDDAIAAFVRAGHDNGNLGNALARAGRVGEARAMMARFEKDYEKSRTGAVDLAMIHTGLGELEQAIDWLERFEQDHLVWPSTFKVALVWDPLRPLPRFQAFLKRHHLLVD